MSKTKEVAAGLRETFGLDQRQANSVASLEIALRKQAETWGMSAEESKLYAMAQQGIPAEALATAKALHKQIQALKDAKAAEDAAKKSAEDMAAKGKATFDRVRSAADKYADEVADLKHQLAEGVISQKTFNAAMKALPKPPSSWMPILKGIGVGLAAVGAAAIGAATGMVAYAKASIQAFDDQGDLADSLGLPVQDLLTMQHAAMLAGSQVADIGPAMQKMQRSISQATQGMGPASKALKTLGLDAKELNKLSAADAFKTISGAFQKIKNPADQTALAMDVFTESGVRVLTTLRAGPEQLAAWQKEAKDLGIALTSADQAVAGEFDDTWDRISLMFTGLGRKIALEFAPIVIDLGTRFIEWGKVALAGGGMVDKVFDSVKTSVQVVAETFNVLKITWLTVQAGITKSIATFLDTIGLIGLALEKVINLIPGMSVSFGSTVSAMAKDMHKLAGEQFQGAVKAFNSSPSASVGKYFDGIRDGARAAAAEIDKATGSSKAFNEESLGMLRNYQTLRDELQKKIEQFNMNESQKKADDLRRAGASPEQIKEVTGLANKVKALEDLKTLKGEAKSLTASLLTPIQKYQLELGKLQKMLKAGVITQEQFGKAAKNLKDSEAKSVVDKISTPIEKYRKEVEELRKLHGAGVISTDQFNKASRKTAKELGVDNTPKLTGAMELNSKDTRTALLQFNMGANKDSQMLKQGAEANGYLRTIATVLTNVNTKTGKVETIKI